MSFSQHNISRTLAGIILIVFLFGTGWQMMYSERHQQLLPVMTTSSVGSSSAEFKSTNIIIIIADAGNRSNNKKHAGINATENSSLASAETTSIVLFADSSTAAAATATTVSKATVVVSITSSERYELMEAYANDPPLKVEPARFKRILLWNEAFYGSQNFGIGNGRDGFRELQCPVWQCETSDNRSDAHQYDAVVFHLRGWRPDDVPHGRSPHQRYVFWSWEAPVWRIYGDDTSGMANFFNWTMTHRWDSDMIHPYGYISPTGDDDVPLHPSPHQMKQLLSLGLLLSDDNSSNSSSSKVNYAQGKTKMAAWFVSHCNSEMSRRIEMVHLIQKYIQVDVYGACGNMTCPKKRDKSFESSEECRDMVANNYKFYFALENALCRHYVTEKFFDNMRRPILPVVFGLHDDHEKLAPPHSFINAAKFENMKALADYLILLDKNDTLYNEYFWWKPHFRVRNSQRDKNQGMCRLCAALHDPNRPPKIYADMTDWWETQAKCHIPQQIS